MIPPDSDQALRAADPVDERRLRDPADSGTAQRLFENITGIPYVAAPSKVRPRRRRPWAYASSLIAAFGIVGGVAYAVAYKQPTKHLEVACFAQASLSANVSATPAHGPDPVAACQDAWMAGHVGTGPVPAYLQACVLRSGAAGVFPAAGATDDVCARLHLAAAGSPVGSVSTYGSTTVPEPTTVEPFFAMRDAVVNALRTSCVGPDRAKQIVRRALDQAGLTDWRVELNGTFNPGRPCASPGFDEANRRVLLIPIPPNP